VSLRRWARLGRFALLVTLVLFALGSSGTAARAAVPRTPWLVISDVHYDPRARGSVPAPLSKDTNGALLDSLLRELKRAYPDPEVVFIAGDFLAHNFHKRAATSTMAYLAERFDRTYPHAQFVIALGNNDSDCGDYEAPLGGAFLHAVALAWAPLVDRHGAAPNFVKTFSRDGGYTAALPRPGLRAVVLNDVYATLRYRDLCGPNENAAAVSLDQLSKTLANEPKPDRVWLVTHVPPGIDAFSTAHLAHRLFVVPFLRAGARERIVTTINDPRNRVALVIAGHTHKFAYRLSDAGAAYDVPILLGPSVSPIFLNSPSFIALDVGPDGAVGNVAETSYHDGRWQRIGDLASLGVAKFDVASLAGLQRRLALDPALRERFATLYSGAGVSEITPQNWKIYWCAATELSAGAFGACASEGGYSIFTARALKYGGALLGVALVLAAVIIVYVVRRKRASAERP
jgi:sphingomyelin phosphodiesterase acid-like 3